jgi:hypothetical protein
MRPKRVFLTAMLLAIGAAQLVPAAVDVVSYPGVAHLAGLNGTAWRTSVCLANPSTRPQQVSLSVVPRGGGAAIATTVTLAASEVRVVPDLFDLLGAPVGAGTLTVAGEAQSWVRVFNHSLGSTYGMAVPAVRTADLFAVGDTVLFPVLRPADIANEPRSNLLLHNPAPDALTIRLTANSGSREVSVPANSYIQLTDVGAFLGLAPGIHLLRATASGPWYGYVAMVDSRSGDPTPAGGLPADGGEPTVLFVGVAGLAGLNGTQWRSSAILANHTGEPQPVQLVLFPRDSGTATTGVELSLQADEVLMVDDLYAALQAPPGAATLAVVGNVKSWVRTFNETPSGSFGDAVPGAGLYDLFEPGLEVAFAVTRPTEVATEARSNLLLCNPNAHEVEVTLAAAGMGPRTVTLPPFVYTQLTNLGATLGLGPGTHVVTARANARWYGAVSTVDPHSGDPSASLPVRPVGPERLASEQVEITDEGTHYQVFLDYSGGASPRAVGEQLGAAVRGILPNYEALIDSLLVELTAGEEVPTLLARAAAILPQLDSAHREELEGFASKVASTSDTAIGDGRLSPDEVVIVNLIEDVTGPAACSAIAVYGARSVTGLPLTARLVDHGGSSLPEIQAVTVIATSSGGLVVNVGYLGFLGIATGVNQAGLMLGDLDSDTMSFPAKMTGLRSSAFDMRHVLEHETTVANAGAYLGRAAHHYPFSLDFIISDASQSRVLENDMTSTGPFARTLRNPDSPLNAGVEWGVANAVASVNSFVLRGNTDNHTGVASNTGRWASFRQGLSEAGDVVTLEELAAIASYHANPGVYPPDASDVYNMGTQEIVIFDPSSASLHVAFHPRQGWLRATPRFVHLQLDE